MSDKIFSYKDFKAVKTGSDYSVGLFAPEIYGLCKYQFGTSSGNGYNEYFKISKKDFDEFPDNEESLTNRLFSNWFINKMYYLCSDYTESHFTFTLEKYNNIKL